MLRYLFLCFSLFMPMRISTLRSLKTFQSYNNRIVCMVPPPGDLPSKMLNSAATPSKGCRTSSQITHNRDGTTTERITMTCNKEVKRDQEGNVVKQTDTTRPDFESGKNMFFGSAPKGSPGGSSSKKR